MNDPTLQVIESAMQSLATEFGMTVVRRNSSRGYAEVTYANDTTGLKVAIEWSELRPFLSIYRRDANEPRDRIPEFSDDVSGVIRIFDVDGLLLLRDPTSPPVGKMLSSRDDVAAARQLLTEYGEALRRYAADVLRGDFTVFAELEREVKARAAAFKDRKA